MISPKILTIRSKETKELLGEFQVSDEVYGFLKKSRNPSEIVETIMQGYCKENILSNP